MTCGLSALSVCTRCLSPAIRLIANCEAGESCIPLRPTLFLLKLSIDRLNSTSSALVSPDTCRAAVLQPKAQPAESSANLELFEFDGHVAMSKDLLHAASDFCSDTIAWNEGDGKNTAVFGGLLLGDRTCRSHAQRRSISRRSLRSKRAESQSVKLRRCCASSSIAGCYSSLHGYG